MTKIIGLILSLIGWSYAMAWYWQRVPKTGWWYDITFFWMLLVLVGLFVFILKTIDNRFPTAKESGKN